MSLHLKDDAFPQPAQSDNTSPFDRAYWRIHRADDEWIADPEPLQRLVQDPRGQGLEVEGDVGEFWHFNPFSESTRRLGFGLLGEMGVHVKMPKAIFR